jgi:putative tricarboxylic transport membrane protein
MEQPSARRMPEAAVAGLVLLTGLGLAAGAVSIPGEAGYGGAGPNFLPWLVAAALTLCGILMLREALTGGFREREAPSGGQHAWWPGLVWISAGMLANAALITTVGFILSCTLCYLLAVQGLRRSKGQGGVNSPRTWLIDIVTGLLISAPVFWMFTKFLAINLPGLTTTGWI